MLSVRLSRNDFAICASGHVEPGGTSAHQANFCFGFSRSPFWTISRCPCPTISERSRFASSLEFQAKIAKMMDSAKSQGKLALTLGVIAIALSLGLGLVYLISVRRLQGEVARLNQQTEGLHQLVERVQEQSQTSAQQASEAAANARSAAQQRDLAKQGQLNSEAQAQLARQQAVA